VVINSLQALSHQIGLNVNFIFTISKIEYNKASYKVMIAKFNIMYIAIKSCVQTIIDFLLCNLIFFLNKLYIL